MMEPGLYCMDCMEAMKQFPDKFFDLAIVDPPYGDGNAKIGVGGGAIRRAVRQIQGASRTGGTWAQKYGKKIIAWDVAPGKEYFDELFRVSRDQIIWGGNYFALPPTRCFLIWDKQQGENFSMAMAEYAWTSFQGNAKIFRMPPMGKPGERFHPTQKPVQLYSWILGRYAAPGMKILDTHAGSASSLVACRMAGLDQAWGFEIDSVYYEKAKQRLDAAQAQVMLCDLVEQEQISL